MSDATDEGQSTVAHTPGPWRAQGCYASCNDPEVLVEAVWASDGTLVAEAIIETCIQDIPEQAAANARLIKASPKMLHALRVVNRYLANLAINGGPEPGMVGIYDWSEAQSLVSGAIEEATADGSS